MSRHVSCRVISHSNTFGSNSLSVYPEIAPNNNESSVARLSHVISRGRPVRTFVLYQHSCVVQADLGNHRSPLQGILAPCPGKMPWWTMRRQEIRLDYRLRSF
jgi:hypothetical protein